MTRENPSTVGLKECKDCQNRFKSFFCTTCSKRYCSDHFEDEKVHEHKRDSIQKHVRMRFMRLLNPAIVGRTA